MQKVTVQVPMSKELKEKAELASADMGFSSLQEAIRIFVTKLSNKELQLKLEDAEEVTLSKSAKRRYEKIATEIEKSVNVTKTENIDELFQLLES